MGQVENYKIKHCDQYGSMIKCGCNISVSLGKINYAEGLSISQMEAEEGLRLWGAGG